MSVEFLETEFEKVSYLASILIARATNGTYSNSEFESLRYELLSNGNLTSLLPKWLKLHRSLDSFWMFIKPKFGTYSERTQFINEEFSDVLNILEFGPTVDNKKKPIAPKTVTSRAPKTITSRASKVIFNHKQLKLAQQQAAQHKPLELAPQQAAQQISVAPKKKVFIVHGRDNEAKQEISRHIESLGIGVIILHEEANSGMTIIEKIEHYANEADFALVLYTACDKGRGAHESNVPPKNRARQNVIFEHGYLMAKLGRKNVCALVKGDVETPNDISGVVYVGLDVPGAWKMAVNKELKACGYKIHSY